MTIYIDEETSRRVNPNAPYKGFSRLESSAEFAKAGVISVTDPAPPEEYLTNPERYYVTESDVAPYVVYTRKKISDIRKAELAKLVASYQADTATLREAWHIAAFMDGETETTKKAEIKQEYLDRTAAHKAAISAVTLIK